MRLYIAGPMSNLPQFNFPAFDAAAAALRARGHTIFNPTEMDSPEWRAAALASPDGDVTKAVALTHQTWGAILGRDIRVVADEVEGIVLLPCWAASRGARLEAFTAILCGKSLQLYDEGALLWYHPIHALAAIQYYTTEQIHGTADF